MTGGFCFRAFFSYNRTLTVGEEDPQQQHQIGGCEDNDPKAPKSTHN
jgi:hypothetical protein